MCIAIVKPLGKKLTKEIYRNCFSNNDDGAGFSYLKNDELYISKGFFTFQDFWEHFEECEEASGLIHFRVGTSGGVTGENCHPWRVADVRNGDPSDLAFIHNGVISISRPNQNLSDTGNFNQLILRELFDTDPDFWKQKEFKWMIENAIGSNNKLGMMDNKGHLEIFNKSAGKEEDGVWFSNGTYSYCKNNNYYTGGNRTYNHTSSNQDWKHTINDDDETVSDAEDLADRVDDSIVNEGDFAGIDTETIDQRLEAAEKARLSKVEAK